MQKFKRAVTDSETGPSRALRPGSQARREQPAGDPRRGHRPHARQHVADGYTQYGPLKDDDRRRRRRGARPDPARYRELHGRPRRAGRLLRAAPTRPAPSPRSRSSAPTAPSACSPPERSRELLAYPRAREVHENGVILMVLLGPTDRRIIALGIPALGTPRRRAAVPSRRHGDRRAHRHRPARRRRHRRHGADARRRRLELPHLRHDRTGRPTASAPGRPDDAAEVGRAGDVARR